MPHNRFFADDPLLSDSVIQLETKEQHHLRVMRNPQTVELINGKGRLATAKVLSHGLKILKVEEEKEPPAIILCQALPRMNRLDTILEKGTEIGMKEIWLFPGARSEKKSLSNNQLERIDHLLIAALKQCGRLYLPKFKLMPELSKWPAIEGQLLYGAVEGGQRLPPLKEPTYFFVGPEAGFSPDEEKWLAQKAAAVSLNPAILRTDTAPLVALSLINYFLINE